MLYLQTVLSVTAVIVGSVAILNFGVDPAELFRKTNFGQVYAAALLDSEYGLLDPDSLDDRDVKAAIALRASNYDCVIVGSSHVMQIGSSRKHRTFPACKSIANLGVAGAGLEDHIVLSYLSLSNGKPRLLILGVDPWTFAFDKDQRWEIRYSDSLTEALKAIGGDRAMIVDPPSRWSNLVNAQYTKRSIEQLLRGQVTRTIVAAQRVDQEAGGVSTIMLPDGSRVYSSEFIARSREQSIPVGGDPYKTKGTLNQPKAIALYKRLLIWLQNNGVKPILLMTPYHPNVWKLDSSPNVVAMVPTEKIVIEIGSELGIPVVGSYRPDGVNCEPEEFFDFMHPTDKCVAKLKFPY